MIMQQLIKKNYLNPDSDDKIFDLLTIELANGDVKKIYFDITVFFGKY